MNLTPGPFSSIVSECRREFGNFDLLELDGDGVSFSLDNGGGGGSVFFLLDLDGGSSGGGRSLFLGLDSIGLDGGISVILKVA